MASSLISQLLKNRGISDTTAIENFLNPKTAFENPFMMKGMKTAVDRIAGAINSGEKITIFGDYDVDGISATAIMARTLSDLGAVVDTYIPKRSDGYGLNSSALQNLAEKGTNLLITVDTGIGNEKEISEISDKFDVIVTDHHLVPESGVPSSAVAVLNPHQAKDLYPNKNLSGAGVAFKLSQALRNRMTGADIQQSVENIELAALATVADVVPMTGENRKIVADGLASMPSSQDKAIQALLKTSGLSEKKRLTAEDIGFKIAPRINAAGRVEDPAIALSLFKLDQKEHSTVFKKLADNLSEINERRKAIEADIVRSAEERLLQLRQKTGGDISSVIVENKGWHEGVVGLAAARLSERHKLPSIVLTSEDGKIWHGSARSVPGFNIVNALRATDRFLLKYGGHEQAAGLTIAAENLDSFKTAFDNFARANLPADIPDLRGVPLDPANMTMEGALELEKMGPFGVGNERPIFEASNVRADAVKTSSDGKHLFFNLGDKRAVAFGAGDLEDMVRNGNVDVTFSFDINEFRGEEKVQLNVKGIKPVADGTAKALSDTTIQDVYKFLRTKNNEPFNASTLVADFKKATGTQISGYNFGVATKILEELGLFSAVVNDGTVFTAAHSGDINLVGSRTYRNLRGIPLPERPARVIPDPVTPDTSVPFTGIPTVTAATAQDTIVVPKDFVGLSEETEKAGITVDASETSAVVQEEMPVVSDKSVIVPPAEPRQPVKPVRTVPSVWDSTPVVSAADVTNPVRPVLISADPTIAARVQSAKQKLKEGKKKTSTKPKKEQQQQRKTDTKPARPEKREQWFIDRINKLIKDFRYPLPANNAPLDEILLGKIRDESLREQINYPDPDLVDKKTYVQELIRLKEEQASRDLDALKKIINIDTDLGKKLVDIRLNEIGSAAEEETLRESYESGNIEAATAFYNEDLAKSRIRQKRVKGKDGKEYLRDTSYETTLNEWLRQLSDTKYPGVTKQVKELRERYIALSGEQNYKQPGSTLHRETVVLREKIGKEIAKRAGKDIEDKVRYLASKGGSLLYRRIADKVTNLENGALTAEQESVINWLMFNFETDVGILESYEKIAETVGLTEKPAKNQSAVDKINFYRRHLSGKLGEIKGRQDIDKLSPGYLDLISANKDKDNEGYKAAKEELIEKKRAGLWDARIRKFENPKEGKPKENLALWLRHADVAIAEQESRKAELLDPGTSFELFQELLEDPRYRAAMPRVEYTKKDGKKATRMAGTRFNNKLYRVGIPDVADIDADRLKRDTNEILKPLDDSIRESRDRIVAARGLTERGLTDQIISLKDSLAITPPKKDDYRLKRLQRVQRLYNFMTSDPVKEIQDKIEDKGYSSGVDKAIYLEEKLKIEADIYEADPNARISLDSNLYGDKRLAALRDIRARKQWAAADVAGLSDGFAAPTFVSKLPVEKQLSWWQTAFNNRKELLEEDFDAFQQRYYSLKPGQRRRYVLSLPVGSLVSDDLGNVYRPGLDEEAVKSRRTGIAQLMTDIGNFEAEERQGLLDYYSKREQDLTIEKERLEQIAEENRTDQQRKRLIEIQKDLENFAEKKSKVTSSESAVDRITRNSAKYEHTQLLPWLQKEKATLQLRSDIRKIIPSISFNAMFKLIDTPGVDNKTKYEHRFAALQEVHDTISKIQKESFDDFQKRVERDGLENLTAWLSKGAFVKIQDKDQQQGVRYYRTFVQEDTDQLDKKIKAKLDIIAEKDQKINEIFKQQTQAKLDFLRKAEDEWPTAEGSNRRIAIEKAEDRLAKLKQPSDAAAWISNLHSYSKRYQKAEEIADELTNKLKILEKDPNIYLGKDFNYDKTDEILKRIEDDTKTVSDIKSRFKEQGYDNKYLSNFGTKAEQAAWWQTFEREYGWLTSSDTTKEQVTAAIDSLDKDGFNAYKRLFPDNFFNTFFVRKNKMLYRVDTDVEKETAAVWKQQQQQYSAFYQEQEKSILNTGQKKSPAPSVSDANVFGIAHSNRMADSSVVDKITAISKLAGQDFSDNYDQLSTTEKELYDRNFGKPIRSQGVWYQNIFVMPDDAWKAVEEQSGRAIPRTRPGVDKQESYDVAAEQELQQRITSDIRGRSWDFVPKTRTAPPVQQIPPTPSVTEGTKESVVETVRPKPVAAVKEQKSAVEKVLQELRSPTTMKSMGMMGLAGAFALWNMAMTGPSREAQEHRRRVEEERRMRQYGY